MTRRIWMCGLVVLAGLLLLLGLAQTSRASQAVGAVRAPAASAAKPAGGRPSVDCSQIESRGLARQMNLRASQILVACGQAKGGAPVAPTAGAAGHAAGGPANYGGADVDAIDFEDPSVYPHVTQSESSIWSNGSTTVVNYNDSTDAVADPPNFSGLSYSTDNGATFSRLLPSPLAGGHGPNYGDPILVWNAHLALWFAGDIVGGCAAQGIGLWTSPDGITWTPGACAHSGFNDDRDSMWVDNSPSSPHYGRMYVSYNDFNFSGQLFVVYSDDGVTWSAPVGLSAPNRFIRDVQATGSPTDGTVFVAGLDEGGGGSSPRTNYMYRSRDGGVSWDQILVGAPYAPPGSNVCNDPYFNAIAPIWRYMGGGQPAVGPDGVVHYVYGGAGTHTGDQGDIYYTRSLDGGDTWSAPVVLNSDQAAGGTHEQWMPSLSATAGGALLASWYDRRNTSDGANYQYYGRASSDNGATWQADQPVSDVLIPQPLQPDPAVASCYAGDYNYLSAQGSTALLAWTDGRNAINGNPQQDVFVDRATLVAATPTPTVTGTPPSPTPTHTSTPTPIFTSTSTPTATPCYGVNPVQNPGFESGNFDFWVVDGHTNPPVVTNTNAHSGTYSALLGGQVTPEPLGDSSIYQPLTVPASGGMLSFWYWPYTTDTVNFDWQDAYVTDASGNILATVMHVAENDQVWKNQTFDMSPFAGQSIRIKFLVHQDGHGDPTAMYIDDVAIQVPGPCGSPTPTNTGTPPTATPQPPTATPFCPPGAWSEAAAYPIPVLDQAVVAQNGIIYSFSGVSSGNLVPNAYKYDAAHDTWTAIRDLPADREAATAVSDGTYIYILGGWDDSGTPTNSVYRYDPAANTYATLPSFNVPTAAQAAAVLNGKIYKITGCIDSLCTPTTTVEVATPGGAWSTVAPYPLSNAFASAVVLNGRLYVAGGVNGGLAARSVHARGAAAGRAAPAATGKTYRYDPGANTWVDGDIADLPVARWGAASAVLHGRWLLGGGTTGGQSDNTLVAWDPNSNAWATLPTLLQPRTRLGGAAVGDSFYAIGGAADNSFNGTSDNQRYLEAPCAAPTATGTPPTALPTATATPTQPTPTATPCAGANVFGNPGFESGAFPPWVVDGTNNPPAVTTDNPHSGATSALLGTLAGQEPNGDSSFYQQITVPANGGTLSFWYWPLTYDILAYDWQDAYVTDLSGNILATIMHVAEDDRTWKNMTFNMRAYAGQTVRVKFLVHEDGAGTNTAMYIDDVGLFGPGGCTTPTPLPTATPACGIGGWVAAAPYPIPVLDEAVAAQNGIVYSFSGVSSGNLVTSAYKYDPAQNTWTAIQDLPAGREAASAVSDGTYLYILGGWDDANNPTTSVYRYDPAANTYTTLPSFNVATAGQAAAVLSGKIYKVAGCVDGVCTTTPAAEAYTISSHTWAPVASYPITGAFASAVTLNGRLYVAGGSGNGQDAGSAHAPAGRAAGRAAPADTAKTYRYDPASNTWVDGDIADLPATRRAAASDIENGRWVLAGGYVNNEVNDGSAVAWDPGANAWTPLPSLLQPRARLAGATAAGLFFAVGGAGPTGTFNGTTDNQRYPAAPCPSPTATAVRSATPTPVRTTVPPTSTPIARPSSTPITPPPTSTPCNITFSDVRTTDYFYIPVEYLACHGVISGYGDHTFRPYNNTTRGQMVKIVVLGFSVPGYSPPNGNTFADVPSTNPFFGVIEAAAHARIVSGYACGGNINEPCDNQNRPYFRPNAYVTRGQLSKIVVVGRGWALLNPPSGTFEDVQPGSAFYLFVETAAARGIISGYSCGSNAAEPCDGANRPYFRQYNNATRGQIAKIVYGAIQAGPADMP